MGSNVEVSQNLQSDLDGNYWTSLAAFLDSTSDEYWAMNIDNVYWGNGNAVMNRTAANVLAAVSDYVHTELSWVLATTY